MKSLQEIILANEEWLTRRIIKYFIERNYSRYTSTLFEAWRQSVIGVSKIILTHLTKSQEIPELEPEDDYSKDQSVNFGIMEAKLHRDRGVSYNLFLGSLKYYRQGYLDLVLEQVYERDYENYCITFVNRCFDRIELGFSSSWLQLEESDYLKDLQRANLLLANEKNHYLTIFESNPNPILIIDENMYIENLNYEAAKLFNLEAIPGANYYSSLLYMEKLPWLNEEINIFIRSGDQQCSFESAYETCGGKQYFIVKLMRMLDVSQKFKGIVVILDNITEKVHLKNEMERLGRLDLVGQMAAGIGHEIRNPMTCVRGFLQMMSNGEDYLPPKDILNLMIDELDRANSIITEYLSLAKNKRVTLEKGNLNSIIENILPLLSSEANRHESRIVFNKENIPDLLLDEKEIRQLIINLVKNGLEAMHKEEKILTIATYEEDKKIVLSIDDQGGGIPVDAIEKVGTPFFTTKDEGVGLGLAICYSIVARHNAVMDFATGENGTKFMIKFNA